MAEKYIDSDYLQEMARLLSAIKEHTYDWMRITPGQQVLDVGCGPGIDTVALAKLIGPNGHVVGVDRDPEMLKKADEHAIQEKVQQRITHQEANVTALPFPEAQFDACRAERLFQVLPTALFEPTLKEMLRVTKSGGWIVAADTDWATASVDFPDLVLERKLMHFFGEHVRPNGFAGRCFWRTMKQHGLVSLQRRVFTTVMSQFSQRPFGEWLIEEALNAHIATQAEMKFWRETLEARDAAGEFYATVTMTVVAGQKP